MSRRGRDRVALVVALGAIGLLLAGLGAALTVPSEVTSDRPHPVLPGLRSAPTETSTALTHWARLIGSGLLLWLFGILSLATSGGSGRRLLIVSALFSVIAFQLCFSADPAWARAGMVGVWLLPLITLAWPVPRGEEQAGGSGSEEDAP